MLFRGVLYGLPLRVRRLCVQPHAEGQRGDASSAAAIDAAVGAIKVNVVEDVVSVKLELSLKSFSDCKGLEHREVRVEEFWSAEAVASDVSEGCHCRLSP